ncbi:MAG: DEAD/DEAH box helicase, partial [Bdellovibrionales bacterium]|nr:DEAD/DEAH box helicase [Bdellovibrionales bacterium]
TVYGGVGYAPQIKAVRRGVDVLVATPGRLVDLINGGHCKLDNTKFLVLDEADRMLDMGFKKDIEKIVSYLPSDRQTLLFSATMPPSIEKLARSVLTEPKRVSIAPVQVTARNIAETVMFVSKENKNALLFKLLENSGVERAIVFTRTKHAAERLATKLGKQNIRSEAIHGNKSQNARQRSLVKFRRGQVRILVATDVAARGIDVDDITHVINYQLSNEPESYVHRIGRTARAGKSGTALTLCDIEDFPFLSGVEKLLKRRLAVTEDEQFHDAALASRHQQGHSISKSKPRPKGKGKRNWNSDKPVKAGQRPARRRPRRRSRAAHAAA